MMNASPLGGVIQRDGLLQVNRNLGAGFDVHRREGLAIEPIDPLRQVLHATGQDLVERPLSGRAGGAERTGAAEDGMRALVG